MTTIESLQERVRELEDREEAMLTALSPVFRLFDAMRYTVGISKSQMDRVEKVRKLAVAAALARAAGKTEVDSHDAG